MNLGLARGLAAVALVAVAAAASACKSSAKKPLLDDISPLDSAAALPVLPQPVPWNPALCPPLPEREQTAAFSDLTFAGTCAFHHAGSVACNARGDDFYAIVHRKLEEGATADLYINVEFFSGAGTYAKTTEVLFIIQRGTSLYRWSNMHASMTLGTQGGGGLSASESLAYRGQGALPLVGQLEPMVLEPEPGTNTTGTISLSGTLGCAP